MLTGAALEKWNDAVHNCTRKPETSKDGTKTDPPRQTEETFKQAKVELKTTFFQTDSLYNMHEYLRLAIKFPVNKGVLVKEPGKVLQKSTIKKTHTRQIGVLFPNP